VCAAPVAVGAFFVVQRAVIRWQRKRHAVSMHSADGGEKEG
jgi:hypothetical protein